MLFSVFKRIVKTPKRAIRILLHLSLLFSVITLLSFRHERRGGSSSDVAPEITIESIGGMLRQYKSDFYPGIFKSHSREFLQLENSLFSWTSPTFQTPRDLLYSFEDRGLVICVSNRYFTLAWATLTAIRRVFNCRLPIQVFYAGDSDLAPKYRKSLSLIDNVQVVDIKSIFNDTHLELNGWSLKPFALLGSSFAEAILIDADTVFFQSPELLFDTPEYQTTGSLFFRDRTLKMYSSSDIKNAPNLVQTLLDRPLFKLFQSNRITTRQSFHEQESGVVVLKKSMHFFGLLATCALNYGKMREIIQTHFWGEKESFWLGMEIMNEPYSFNRWLPGASGVVDKKNSNVICSQQLLHSYDSKPFWYYFD